MNVKRLQHALQAVEFLGLWKMIVVQMKAYYLLRYQIDSLPNVKISSMDMIIIV